MGRAPCCDKANVKRGPWSPEEDAKLKSYIQDHGTGSNWIALPQKIGLKRCGKSCRLRWLNYLRPNIKHGGFSEEEDTIICGLYMSIGSRWSIIAAQLPGRTDNDIKNYWNTRLKKKLLGKQRKEQQAVRQASKNYSNKIVKQEKESDDRTLIPPPCPPDQAMMNPNPYMSFRYPGDIISSANGQLYSYQTSPMNMLLSSSTSPMSSINSSTNCSPLLPTPAYGCLDNFFPIEPLDDLANAPQQLDGLDNIVNGGSITSNSAESSCTWGGDISNSLIVCPPIPLMSNYEDGQQGMLQNCAYDQESRYLLLQ